MTIKAYRKNILDLFKYVVCSVFGAALLNLFLKNSFSKFLFNACCATLIAIVLFASITILNEINSALKALVKIASKNPLLNPLVTLFVSLTAYLSHSRSQEYISKFFGYIILDYFSDFVVFCAAVTLIHWYVICLFFSGLLIYFCLQLSMMVIIIYDLQFSPLIESIASRLKFSF